MTSTRARGGMAGHHRPNDGETSEWLTPRGLFERLGLRFALDPCAPAGGVPWIPARRSYSLAEDGLTLPWRGRVWLNPPYGAHVGLWLERLAAHGDGLALVFARTDTAWWHRSVPSADAVCFIAGRLTFVRADGEPVTSNSGAPSALVAWGEDCTRALEQAQLGMLMRPVALGERRACEQCGRLLPRGVTKRRRFCDELCRVAHWRAQC